MKKVLSVVALLAILSTTGSNLFAQKSKLAAPRSGATRTDTVIASKARIAFGEMSAVTSGSGVLLRWNMKSEKSNIGFRIYRINGFGQQLVNSEPVYGSASKAGSETLYGEEYAYFDREGTVGSVYTVESQDMVGNRLQSGPITASNSKGRLDIGSEVPGSEKSTIGDLNPSTDTTALELPKEVSREVESQASPTEDHDMHLWLMSQPGVRIDVRAEGLYRVSFADLQSAGFNTASDSSNWQLYLRGVQQAITVNAAQSHIEFYGKGVDTQETDIQGYFLINGPSAGKRMANQVSRPSNSTVLQPGYRQQHSYRERSIYLGDILNGPAENYFGRSIPAAGTTITFNLNGVDLTSPTSTLNLKIQGYSFTLHTVRITLNGEVLELLQGVSQFSFTTTKEFPTSLLKDASLGQGSNTLNLASIAGGGDFNLFDSFSIDYSRKQLAQQNTLKAYAVNAKKTLMRGFTSSNVRVFDVTNENEPRLITNLPFRSVDGAFGVDLPGARPKVYYAVDDSAIKTPFAIKSYDAEVLSSPTHGAQLVIISDRNLRTQADQWAAYRAAQGVSVKVVNVEEIMNEFNYGVLSPDPIEAFLNYAYDNWQVRPKYALLIGDASFDSRNYQGQGYNNAIPSRLVTTIFTETASDESLADFDDDGLSEIAIGRIPARTAASVTTALNKTMNWETNLPANPLTRGGLFAYDQNDGYEFDTMSGRIRDEINWPAGVTPTMVFRNQPNAAADLLAGINTGKYIVNYAGHGSTGAWASTNFFWNGNVTSLTNANNESLFTMLTCLNGYFISFNGTSLAEALLDANNGGAVAAWASTGKTTADVQEVMARRFYNQVGQGNIPRIGDLIADAKTTLLGGTDVRLSWALLGDPMLKVR